MGTVATPVRSNPGTNGGPVILASAKGTWNVCHLNASATAQTAAELIRPGSVSSSNVVPIELGESTTRVLLRCRYGAAGTGTGPTVRIIAAYGRGLIPATTIPDDGTMEYAILVRAQALSIAPTTDVRDATYSYSDPFTLPGTDMLGANYLLVFVEVAASITGATPVVECCLLN